MHLVLCDIKGRHIDSSFYIKFFAKNNVRTLSSHHSFCIAIIEKGGVANICNCIVDAEHNEKPYYTFLLRHVIECRTGMEYL